MSASIATPPRIALFSVLFWPRIGGAEMQGLKLAKALRARGVAVRVFTLRHDRRWPREDSVEGVPITRIGGVNLGGRLRLGVGVAWISYLAVAWALWRARRDYDLIQATSVSPWAGFLAVVGRLARKPVFVTSISAGPDPDAAVQEGQTTWLYPGTPRPDRPWALVKKETWVGNDIQNLRRNGLRGRIALRLLRAPGVRFLAISRRIAAIIQREMGVGPDRVWQMTNIVFIPPDRHPRVIEPLTVLCVARHSYEKGIDVLLAAWAIVQRELPTARLRLVGDGPLHLAMRRLAATLDLGDSVIFLGQRTDVGEQLLAASVYAQPSRWEGMPNALLEAMAQGLPCVATRVSGAEDVIESGVSGLLVPPQDHEALAAAILRLLRDTPFAARCGAAARERMRGGFTGDILSERYLALCAQALGRPAPRAVTADAVVIPEE